jgi:hypothetical protein
MDTSAGWWRKQKQLADNSEHWKPPFQSSFWETVPKRYDKIRIIDPTNKLAKWFEFAYFAALNAMGTDAVYLARVDSNKLQIAKKKAIAAVTTGEYERDSVYIIGKAHVALAASKIKKDKDLLVKIGDNYIVAPGWVECDECPSLSALSAGLTIDETIDFDKAGTGGEYLVSGWSQPGALGVWSDGPMAVIALPIVAAKDIALQLDLEARAFLHESHQRQIVRVDINGNRVGIIEFSSKRNRHIYSLSIPKNAVSGNNGSVLIITLEIASPIRPIDVGISGDRRNLGIGLLNLTIRARQ